jgi:uncharacterized oligopeptide transporter (OPT) family protein
MALKMLTEEQIKTMTLKEKDEWWLKNVYRGDMPQLTWRSSITGFILGSVLALTNLQVGMKVGWSLGVGITSVILAFSFFKILSRLGWANEMTILENNAMQSIATSAGYMTAPLISSIPAFMLVTNQVLNPWHVAIWMICLSILGVIFAFPLKKRFINDEQLPFPEGFAAAVVMDGLHDGEHESASSQDQPTPNSSNAVATKAATSGLDGIFKAKILTAGAVVASLIEVLRDEPVLKALKLSFLQLPEYWDDLVYKIWTPTILNTPLKDLTVRFDSSILMMGAGGLMGMKTAVSLLLGGVLNYFILAPYFIQEGVIHGVGFKNITMWSLWGGVAMMTTSSLFSFLSKPKQILQAFKNPFQKNKEEDILKDIEVPSWVFLAGLLIFGPLAVIIGHYFFHMEWWLGMVALPLVFIFTLIAVNSTGLTAITPSSALGKLTQLTFAVISPKNIGNNIMSAAINSEVASNASNLLMDIKPGYMLGAKPRQQIVGHVIGIFAGSLLSIPVFYLLFQGDLTKFGTEQMPMPSVQVWKSVAEVLMKGFEFLHPSVRMAIVIGALLGLTFEILNIRMKGKFPLSAVGMGLAFVLKFSDIWSMFFGAFIFWMIGVMTSSESDSKNNSNLVRRIFVDNQETLAAGVIAGGSLIGIILTLLNVFVLS